VETSPPVLGGASPGLRSVRAECPAGKMAIGGNYAVFAVGGNYTNGIMPVSSGLVNFTGDATKPPNAFFVITVDQPGYASTPFFRVQAFCAKAP
jgi:hypothetical protein